jgi:hypothetical protein
MPEVQASGLTTEELAAFRKLWRDLPENREMDNNVDADQWIASYRQLQAQVGERIHAYVRMSPNAWDDYRMVVHVYPHRFYPDRDTMYAGHGVGRIGTPETSCSCGPTVEDHAEGCVIIHSQPAKR